MDTECGYNLRVPVEPPQRPIAEIPPEEVRRICAGEVVERPLNVVKELAENALDAGASSIDIELEEGGKQLIRVSDDGRGIPGAELPLALLPHHTSKLTCLEDLYAISTLGFRGEALSSVAAVSRLSIESRSRSEQLGTRLQSVGGEIAATEAISRQPGTQVEVRDIFFNTAPRLKFLRSRSAESAQVSALLTAYALAYPEVRWTLRSSGRVLLRTTGDGDRARVLAELLGPELGDLVPIDFEFPPSAVRGLISDPSLHRSNRSRQWYYVNRRPVTNRLLFKAVDDAVREFMSPGKHPAGVFFLELPPEEIDVNVHPMKSEVNFAQPQAVYSLLVTALRRALGSHAGARQQRLSQGLAAVIQPRDWRHASIERSPAPDTSAARLPLQNSVPTASIQQLPPGNTPAPAFSYPAGAAPGASLSSPAATVPPLSPAPGAPQIDAQVETLGSRVSVRQVADSYIVVTTDEAVYLVDQHSAHERILFEQIYESFERQLEQGARRQKLLFALPIALGPAEAQQADEICAALRALGFELEPAAGPSLVVHEVPQILGRLVTAELLSSSLEELARMGTSGALADAVKQLAASLACRAAVKAGQRLPESERSELIRQLLARWSSLSCPHGRPTIVRLGPGELERLFLRDSG